MALGMMWARSHLVAPFPLEVSGYICQKCYMAKPLDIGGHVISRATPGISASTLYYQKLP